MRRLFWPVLALVALWWLVYPASAPAQIPQDDQTVITVGSQDPDSKDNGVDRDDPTARLEWERQAWGRVTDTFRRNVFKEGRDHSDRKNLRGRKWVSIGPAGAEFEQNGSFTGEVRDSGRVRTILPHPTNPDVVYVLTSGGGLWRTNNWMDEATKWKPLTDHLPTTGGGSVAFGRQPGMLYLGLGDPYDQINVGGAMTRSMDGGDTWRGIFELGSAVSVRDVKVDTSTNRDIVLVATDAGLFRSADEGTTYAVVPGFEGQSVWSLARTNAGWLVSAQPCPVGFGGLQCGRATTLSLSTDRGATWAPISNAGNVFSVNGRTTLGVGVAGDAVVYAYSSNQSDTAMRDVYRSADGGQTWVANGVNATKIPSNPVAGSMANMNICQSQCWYDQMLVVDPRDATRNTLWIGGNLAAAQSTTGGANWTLKTWWLYSQVPGLPYAHADHHTAVVKLTGTPTLILGNDGGLNISEDNGATFSSDKNNGLVSFLFYTVGGSKDFPNLVIAGAQDNGTRLRTDDKNTYNQVIGGDGMGTAYSKANTNTVLGSAQGSSMRTNLSNNPPEVFQNWASATSGLSDVGFGFFTAIVPAPSGLDPTGRVFFHFSNSRVWRTNNGGLTWTRLASAIAPTSPGLPANRRFRSSPYNLSVSPTDLNRIAVGAGGGFIDVTTDGGASWTDINLVAKVPGYLGFVTNVAWQDDRTIWITSVAQAPGAVRVIKAAVASPGDSWSSAVFSTLQIGLPDVPVSRVYFDPTDPTHATIYAATHVGVYQTTTGGAQWDVLSNGLPNVRVNDIYMPPDGGSIRIATYGRGVWELPQLELVRTVLTDNSRSDDKLICDRDGVLDNGETGSLAITLRNLGSNNVSRIEVTVTSSNPHVTFPRGNVIGFRPVQKRGESTETIAVALNGAVGVEETEFQISINAPELDLPSAMIVTSTHRLNYDEVAQASTTETVETRSTSWTATGGLATRPNILPWQVRALSPTQHVWWGPDNNGQTDGVRPDGPDEQVLTSPSMHVGAGALVVSFSHRFSFEGGGWDGGVVEISPDNGGTWTDIGNAAYNGSTNGFTTAPIGSSRRAFVNRLVGWPAFSTASLNLGTAFADRDVRIRFRVGADESTGAPGWEIDNIDVSGVTNTPFGALKPDVTACTPRKSESGR